MGVEHTPEFVTDSPEPGGAAFQAGAESVGKLVDVLGDLLCLTDMRLEVTHLCLEGGQVILLLRPLVLDLSKLRPGGGDIFLGARPFLARLSDAPLKGLLLSAQCLSLPLEPRL